MLDLILYMAASWIIVGLVCAAVIFLIQSKRGEKNLIWPVIGFVLSLIGLLLFYILVMRKPAPKDAYPAKPQYEMPAYKFDKKDEAAPAPAAKKEEKSVQQLEGAPRCPGCGTAISTHDLKCPGCGKELRKW